MNKILELTVISFLIMMITTYSFSKNNFFDKAMKLYENKKYVEARFLFERNIVFNPKDANSYLYLAKIYNYEKNQRKEEYNLETAI